MKIKKLFLFFLIWNLVEEICSDYNELTKKNHLSLYAETTPKNDHLQI